MNEIETVKAKNKLERLNRMNIYVKKTHQSFLNNIELANQLQIKSGGVLAGPVLKKRIA